MHVLAGIPDHKHHADDAIDLHQSPADIVFLSAADSELNLINQAYEAMQKEMGDTSLRLANLLQLRNNASVDLYIKKTLSRAKLVVIRLLGGASYWSYGVEEIAKLGNVVFLPGDEKWDDNLFRYCSNIEKTAVRQLWQYLVHGGLDNAKGFLQFCDCLMRKTDSGDIAPPVPLPKAGLYHPHKPQATLQDFKGEEKPVVAILFYRAYLQAADLHPINELFSQLQAEGLSPLPIYCGGLKDHDSAVIVGQIFQTLPPNVILNSLGFHLSGGDDINDISAYWQGQDLQAPVLQIILSSQSQEVWQNNNNPLHIRDIAMYVALTELNGNILSRAVSFKHPLPFSEATQIAPAVNKALPDRIGFTVQLAKAYCDLQATDNKHKKIALVLANYPGKDGRLANGVGLDTPASTIEALSAMQSAGYNVSLDGIEDSARLMEKLQSLPTNAVAAANSDAHIADREIEQTLSLPDYNRLFATLPQAVQDAITKQWGDPTDDPFFIKEQDGFALPFFLRGNIAIGIQPARGYHIDPTETYHDPALVPTHNYCAVYLWLRHEFAAQAIVHLGKHGNLEWLPGKALALSENCYPEAMLGPVPHIYPFIINDPGEGSQAKRRTFATIIDHLTPPMVRAENYGILSEMESLCDEYHESVLLDPKRAHHLHHEILNFAAFHKLDKDGNIDLSADESEILSALDGFLCELKESQIRGGLHVLMTPPKAENLHEFAVALLRYPRFDGIGENQSILTAIAEDLQLSGDFNPLDCDFSELYEGNKPEILQSLSQDSWRHAGDTIERLNLLAEKILSEAIAPVGEKSQTLLSYWQNHLLPMLELSAERERTAFLRALDGAFIGAGASGAPTRARLDILPTGRNFYSVDVRSVPTAAAWTLGWASAEALLARHVETHGDYPAQVAVNVWGTSNMRTGGDDIAQAMALLGVRPTWDAAARRVTGFEILPITELERPRIDVTLRISGFFRDAFPSLVELFDNACRAVQKLDESDHHHPTGDNPAARHYRESYAELQAQGHNDKAADLMAGRRIFGSASGAYGAGLQALMDEGVWENRADIAATYMQWGSYAYGVKDDGTADKDGFAKLLKRTAAVIHNQDNREHDLLDSDDYYQFEGGISAAIETLSGKAPTIYHNDHANPAAPKIRTLDEEMARTVRARASNPKWLEAIMQHGYKGAFEIAATVDYLFAFAATTEAVQNHHFDLLFDAYVGDRCVRDFMLSANPSAFQEMTERFTEAVERGLWKPHRNDWAEIVKIK